VKEKGPYENLWQLTRPTNSENKNMGPAMSLQQLSIIVVVIVAAVIYPAARFFGRGRAGYSPWLLLGCLLVAVLMWTVLYFALG